jgi:hypothetical protein
VISFNKWNIDMKMLSVTAPILLAAGLSAPPITRAQGTTYVSNLGQPSVGSGAIGSDSWLAVPLFTGTNPGGYLLNFIQLRMNDASGLPSGFTVMLYDAPGYLPGSTLGSLSGSPDPSAAGIYDFTSPSSLILAPQTHYAVVLTAGTPIANGAYEWSLASSYAESGGWVVFFPGAAKSFRSTDGSSWQPSNTGFFQFALNATPVPEPGTLGLIAFGGLCLIWLKNQKSRE